MDLHDLTAVVASVRAVHRYDILAKNKHELRQRLDLLKLETPLLLSGVESNLNPTRE